MKARQCLAGLLVGAVLVTNTAGLCYAAPQAAEQEISVIREEADGEKFSASPSDAADAEEPEEEAALASRSDAEAANVLAGEDYGEDGELYNDLATSSDAEPEEWELLEVGELAGVNSVLLAEEVQIVDETVTDPEVLLDEVGRAENAGTMALMSLAAEESIEADSALYRDQLEAVEEESGLFFICSVYDAMEDHPDDLSFSMDSFYEEEVITDTWSDDNLDSIRENLKTGIQVARDAFVYDHPENFWQNTLSYTLRYNIKNNSSFTGFVVTAGCTLSYKTDLTEDEIAEMKELQESGISEALNELSESDAYYPLLKDAHDYLADNAEYDHSLSGLYSWSAYGAFVGNETEDGEDLGKTVVCEGYSKAFKTLCDRLDIPCLLIVGQGGTSSDDMGAHMWNYVQMEDGNWYAVDVTWDDQSSGIRYDYFLSGSETEGFSDTTFSASHVEVHSFSENGWEFSYPSISETAYENSSEYVTLAFAESEITVNRGESFTPAYTLTPDEDGATITWSVSDETIISVDDEGNVQALGTGTAYLIAKPEGGVGDRCMITVKTPVTGISFENTEITLEGLNTVVQLNCTIEPSDADNQDVSWSSSDETVASVDVDGLLTAISEGEAVITVTTADGGLTAQLKVTVQLSDVDRVTLFTHRCYEYLFATAGTWSDDDCSTWAESLSSGSADCASFLKTVFLDTQKTEGLTDEDFIQAAYQALFDREPTEAETETALERLSIGMSRTYIFSGLLETDEFAEECTDLKISAGTLTLSENRDLNEQVTGFVARCYELILGRSADVSGLNSWTGKLLEKTNGGAEIVDRFFSSTEYTAKNNSDEEHVELLYQSMMGRAADASGKASWVSTLEEGVSLHYVINRFASSTEFKNLCSSYGIDPGSITLTENRDKNLKVTGFVSRCYRKILDRTPDADGLNSWTGKLLAKSTGGAAIVDRFFTGTEYTGKNLSDQESVKRLYLSMMGREADDSGLSNWVSVLDKGVSMHYLVNRFAVSTEFKKLCSSYGIDTGSITLTENRDKNIKVTEYVARCYRKALGREYDTDGLNQWVGQLLQKKITAAKVAERFVFSSEAVAKNWSDTEFVEVCYRVCMGREADASGLSAWVTRLQNGMSRRSAFASFTSSKEFSNIVAGYHLN